MATDINAISLTVARNPSMGDHPNRQSTASNGEFSKSLDNVGKQKVDQADSSNNVNRANDVDKANKADNKKSRANKSQQEKELEALVGDLQNTVVDQKLSVSFSLDKELNRTVVKVTDQSTGKVVRQIPSEEMVDHLKHIKHLNDQDRANKLVGIIFSEAV